MGNEEADLWFGSEGSIDGLPALVRARKSLPPGIVAATHPRLLKVIWKYPFYNENQMPSEVDSDEMGEFEEVIVAALEENHLCSLFAVVTHAGYRTWKFYCRDKSSTQEAVFSALGKEGTLPIELEIDDDAEWLAYTEILQDCGHVGKRS